MSDPTGSTRRTFLKTASGTVLLLTTPVSLLYGDPKGCPPAFVPGADENGWMGPPGQARSRIEGLLKVTGQKIYARDFRARDMEHKGWPSDERVALVLRATHADRSFKEIDLAFLPETLQPRVIVDAAQMARDQIAPLFPDTSPPGRPPGLMVAKGEIPIYLGQPLAILIFENIRVYRRAHRRLQFNPDVVQYGSPVGELRVVNERGEAVPYSPPTYLTRGTTADGRDFSQVDDGKTNPHRPATPSDHLAIEVRDRIRKQVEREVASGRWKVYESNCSTQVLDPMFMEPEAGLAWFDSAGHTMHLVLGTQSANGDFGDATSLFTAHEEDEKRKVTTVDLTTCYPGGGFGGRDESPFAPLLMLAAWYADAPVRIAHDRFEQFQAGIKQLGSKVKQRLAVDSRSGRLHAIESTLQLPAGGKNNYSQFAAALAGYSAGGAYRFPGAAVDATAEPTAGVVAGSMRGFGGPQANFALETLVDEIAEDLNFDPIELRQINALHEGDRTLTGAPLTEPMRIGEICDLAAANPLWLERKSRQPGNGRLYGVGFALANQAFGVGGDGVMATVGVDPEGAITVSTNCVDMGNGSATTLAISTAKALGANADRIGLGEVAPFNVLKLWSKAPKGMESKKVHAVHHLADVDHPWNNPSYTPSVSLSSSACLTAFHQVHVVEQAGDVLMRTGLWPAAQQLWKNSSKDPEAWKRARWEDGHLVYDGLRPLSLATIAKTAHAKGLVTAAMVHAYYAGSWVEADYKVGNVTGHWPIDALATRSGGSSDFKRHDRSNTKPPEDAQHLYGRSLYSPSAVLAAVEVEDSTGAVSVTDVHLYLDAGTVRQPDLLSGQFQGGLAMGVGYALLEDLPIVEGGAGDGTWNLDRYHVALAGDLPLGRIKLELLPPLDPQAPGKGIAESVLSPVPPAIANAVAAATGRRFHHLPITPEKIREALS